MRLFHRTWTVPALAELHRARGAKFITLINRLGASRPALRQTLDETIAFGWVMRNPGYGHPLRPEYILTPAGHDLAPICADLADAVARLDAAAVAGRKWSMPVLHAIGRRTMRFGAIRARLGGITDRALTLALKDLIDSDLIERHVFDDYPPQTEYVSAAKARPLLAPLDRLARVLADEAG